MSLAGGRPDHFAGAVTRSRPTPVCPDMTTKRLHLAAVALALATLTVACGGDDSPTAEISLVVTGA